MKHKKCKQCQMIYQPTKPLQQVCTYECAIAKAKAEREKKEAKEWNKRKKKAKEKLKTLTDWKKDLEKEINAIVKLIDKGMSCVSCGGKIEQAGHYHSVGSNDSIRFNLDNIYGQCIHCNMHLSGNIIGYDLGLIDVYGKEYWEYVKFELVKLFPICKFTVEDLQFAIQEARAIKRELIKADMIYPAKVRLRLRTELNKRIELY